MRYEAGRFVDDQVVGRLFFDIESDFGIGRGDSGGSSLWLRAGDDFIVAEKMMRRDLFVIHLNGAVFDGLLNLVATEMGKFCNEKMIESCVDIFGVTDSKIKCLIGHMVKSAPVVGALTGVRRKSRRII